MAVVREKLSTSWLRRLHLEEGWLSFVLLLLAVMTVVWSLQTAHWVAGSEILSTTALLGFAVGFVLARTRFVPAILAHSFMLSVGLVLVGLLIFPYTDQRFDEWYYKMGNAVQRVARWLASAFQGRNISDELVGLVGLAFLSWALAYISAWMLFRRHTVWWSISPPLVVLLLNLAYNPPNALVNFAIFLIAALFLVIRFNVFENHERWSRSRLYVKPGILYWTLGLGFTITFLLLAIAFAAPNSTEFKPLQNIFEQVSAPFQNIQNGVNSFFSAPNGGEKRVGRLNTGFNTFNKSFTIGGPIYLSNDPILRVKGTDPSYLQAAVMDQYDGKGWIATYQDVPDSKELIFPQLSLGVDQRLPTSPYTGRFENTLDIVPLQSGIGTLFTGGDTVSTNRNTLLAFHWEKTVIRANLTQIQSKEVGKDVNGRARILLVDTITNKPIPPDLLPLVRLLRDANTMPGFIEVRPIGEDATIRVGIGGVFNNGTAKRLTDGTIQLQSGNWIIRLDGAESPNFTHVWAKRADNTIGDIEYPLIARGNGVFSFGQSTSGATRQDFETTSISKDIKAELDLLVKAPFPSKADYSIANGVPNFLAYEGYQPNYDDLLAVTASVVPSSGDSYRTVALRYRADEQALRTVSTTTPATRGRTAIDPQYPDWVKERYLPLPNTVPQRVKDLAKQLTAGKTNDYDKAKAIEAYLRTLKYNLQSGFTPEGRDAVDYLLFDSKEGYCVHFSTAFTVMMRSVGVPSRVVTGFVGGEADKQNGGYLVRASASHAWPQVFFSGIGWVNFEPTPAYSPIVRPADPASVSPLPTPTPEVTVAPTPTATSLAPAATTAAPNPTGSANSGSTSTVANAQGTQDSFQIPFWVYLIVTLLIATAAIYFGFKLWYRRQFVLNDTSPRAVYARLLITARKAGLPNRQTMTPYEYSRFLSSYLPEASNSLEQLTSRYVRDRYSRQGEAQVTTLEHAPETEVSGAWQAYMQTLLTFRKQRLLERLTPRFMQKHK
ncbi:transglutaminase domain-containing protein [Candidatus Chlorohelix sp.]|uniref:DUF4129 domain-containing transglutaminase family protein n=1 Tax=Candidatus Chlorohelix sp. TaxID=3139201 RepID=UPI00305537E8